MIPIVRTILLRSPKKYLPAISAFRSSLFGNGFMKSVSDAVDQPPGTVRESNSAGRIRMSAARRMAPPISFIPVSTTPDRGHAFRVFGGAVDSLRMSRTSTELCGKASPPFSLLSR